jgi:4-amino-4-deoxy-L-arabinose transferase-like glycosyltransferase
MSDRSPRHDEPQLPAATPDRTWWRDRASGRWRRRSHWIDGRWLATLLAMALLLFGLNLDRVPLRDWDEGIAAQVAREMLEASPEDQRWIFPTLNGRPYFNKPPLVHWAMAASYRVFGVNEMAARLPGALLTALSVPLVYAIAREAFWRRSPAVWSALVYLTWLPVVRHGRLAMLDGAILCFATAVAFCALKARRNVRWALGTGLALGAIAMTKGILVLPFAAIVVGFWLWDTPRLLRSPYLWLGLLLGLLPIGGWYGLQAQQYGTEFLQENLWVQSFGRVAAAKNDRGGPPWYYVLELLKYGWPWLLFVPAGAALAWRDRLWPWARLALMWVGIYGLTISLMGTKLPWYILPLYPPLALLAGRYLAVLWEGDRALGLSIRPRLPRVPFPRAIAGLLAVMGVASLGGGLYFAVMDMAADWAVVTALGLVGGSYGVAAWLFAQRDSQSLPVLAWGTYVALAVFMASGHWVWELGENFAVKPVAALLQTAVPPKTTVYGLGAVGRPSLNFYCNCEVVSRGPEELQELWTASATGFALVPVARLGEVALVEAQELGRAEGLVLLGRDRQETLSPPESGPVSVQNGNEVAREL